MDDPSDEWFEDAADAAFRVIEEHHPDIVFPDLDEDSFDPFASEWESAPGFLTMICGCVVEVNTGDKVWFIDGSRPNSLIPVAIEPVTIH